MKRKLRIIIKHLKIICWTALPAIGIIASFYWLMGFACPAYRNVTLADSIINQGNTLSVQIEGLRPNASLTCWYKGQEIPLYDNGSRVKKGLIAIPVLEKKGRQKISFSYKNFWQELRRDSKEFMVEEKEFKKEHIRFSESKRKLYKNPNISSDRQKLGEIYRYETPLRKWTGKFIWPVEKRVTSPFGTHRIYDHSKTVAGYHQGVDISAPTGTKIYAANGGVVCMAEKLVLSGYTIAIDHGQGVVSYYKHLSKLDVSEGLKVAPGDLIGRAGSGGLSTGPHLHWEIRVHSVPVNPLEWLEKEF
ncbi:MAG: M23 family metallopeptidase [bacterium]